MDLFDLDHAVEWTARVNNEGVRQVIRGWFLYFIPMGLSLSEFKIQLPKKKFPTALDIFPFRFSTR